jgi:RimJ/RimL family protein N-acetyltransferase
MNFDTCFPAGFYLETSKVLMRPLEAEDINDLLPLAQSADWWKYFTKELNDKKELQLWINEALEDRSHKRKMPFTITDKAGSMVCGTTSFGNISFYDKRIEIGWTWLGENYIGSGINRHCKYALLRYAFEGMQFERVEIKTDNLNERAKKALRKIGATEEGVLRSHMQMPHNRRRDSVYFSILRPEWENVKRDFFSDINL